MLCTIPTVENHLTKSTQQKHLLVVITPTLPEYKVLKLLGVVHCLTVRARGVDGKFVAGIEGMFGGEVTNYSSETEKERKESLQRLIDKATAIGANAVIVADFETRDSSGYCNSILCLRNCGYC